MAASATPPTPRGDELLMTRSPHAAAAAGADCGMRFLAPTSDGGTPATAHASDCGTIPEPGDSEPAMEAVAAMEADRLEAGHDGALAGVVETRLILSPACGEEDSLAATFFIRLLTNQAALRATSLAYSTTADPSPVFVQLRDDAVLTCEGWSAEAIIAVNGGYPLDYFWTCEYIHDAMAVADDALMADCCKPEARDGLEPAAA